MPSSGTSAKYKKEEVSFISSKTVTWSDRVKRDEAKGYNYYHNKIKRSWLNSKGINAHDIEQLRDLGVLAWTKDSYPYVHFTDKIRRDGKYALFQKMRELGWNENSPKWIWLEIALRKHVDYILTRDQIERFGLHDAVRIVGWPIDSTDYQTKISDPSATINQEIYSAA
jgi:hypothetical protein